MTKVDIVERIQAKIGYTTKESADIATVGLIVPLLWCFENGFSSAFVFSS